MPASCSVFGCSTIAGRGIPLYRFPSRFNNRGRICKLSSERLEEWIRAVRRGDLTESKIKNGRICALHFISRKKADLKDKDNLDWIPSINMGYESTTLPTPSLAKLNRRNKSKAIVDERTNTSDVIEINYETETLFLNEEQSGGSIRETSGSPILIE